MSEASAVPPVEAAAAADPEFYARVLTDILSSPPLTNGEAATADDFLGNGSFGGASSWEGAVLAAARYCFQVGGLSVKAVAAVPLVALALVV